MLQASHRMLDFTWPEALPYLDHVLGSCSVQIVSQATLVLAGAQWVSLSLVMATYCKQHSVLMTRFAFEFSLSPHISALCAQFCCEWEKSVLKGCVLSILGSCCLMYQVKTVIPSRHAFPHQEVSLLSMAHAGFLLLMQLHQVSFGKYLPTMFSPSAYFKYGSLCFQCVSCKQHKAVLRKM